MQVRTVDLSLVLYAEHGYAASNFACRVTTSTMSDAYSAVCTAIGAAHVSTNDAFALPVHYTRCCIVVSCVCGFDVTVVSRLF